MNSLLQSSIAASSFWSTRIVLPNLIISRSFKRYLRPSILELKNRKNKSVGKDKPAHRSTFLDWNYNSEIFAFGKRLGEEFDDNLLRRALTEKSYVYKQQEDQRKIGIEDAEITIEHNYDMVTHGETLIRRFVLQYLRHVLPRLPEEGINSIAENLMSDETLANISSLIGTSDVILCLDFPVEKSTHASVLKAIVSAVARSSGEERAATFVRDFVVTQTAEKDINELWYIHDPIGVLAKICHNEGVAKPEPRIIGEAGVSTIMACYRIGLFVNKEMIGLGAGESVEIAHEMAARDTLRRLFKTSDCDLRIRYDVKLDPKASSVVNVSLNDWCDKNVQKRLDEANNV